MKNLVSLQDVADLLDIKPDTAWRWVRDGYLPSVVLGRSTGKGRQRRTLRFDMEEIRKWLAAQKQPGRLERVPRIEI